MRSSKPSSKIPDPGVDPWYQFSRSRAMAKPPLPSWRRDELSHGGRWGWIDFVNSTDVTLKNSWWSGMVKDFQDKYMTYFTSKGAATLIVCNIVSWIQKVIGPFQTWKSRTKTWRYVLSYYSWFKGFIVHFHDTYCIYIYDICKVW